MKLINKLRQSSYYGDFNCMVSMLDYQKDAELLDLGCSDGIRTLMFARKIGTKLVTGIDIRSKNFPFNFLKWNLEEKLPLKDNSFDVITASHVIEHLSSTDTIVKEAFRLLKPNGYFLIATPNLASGRIIFELLLNKQPTNTHVSDWFIIRGDPADEWRKSIGNLHRRLFTIEGLSILLEHYGFTVKDARGTGYGPFIFGKILRGRYASNIIVKAVKCGQ